MSAVKHESASAEARHHSTAVQSILGIHFYTGSTQGALARAKAGGLIVVPAAPLLVEMVDSPQLSQAIQSADLAITDSGFMVLLWWILKWQKLNRISGLEFMQALVKDPAFKASPETVWVMPTKKAAEINVAWLQANGVNASMDQCYIAPHYNKADLQDPDLLAFVKTRRPQHVIMGVGGGVQERLGAYVRDGLDFKPMILCTGAAIAFMTGEQVGIPTVVDRLYLGWLARCVSSPKRFIPRYLRSLTLFKLMWRHGEHSPMPSISGAYVH